MIEPTKHFLPGVFRTVAHIAQGYFKGRRRSTITLKPSCFSQQWIGISRLMLQWKFTDAIQYFSVEDLARFASSNFVLCCRTHSHHYKFWDCDTNLFPLYDGETLYSDTQFELWSSSGVEDGYFDEISFLLPVSVRDPKLTSDIILTPNLVAKAYFCNTPVQTPGMPPFSIQFTDETPTCV